MLSGMAQSEKQMDGVDGAARDTFTNDCDDSVQKGRGSSCDRLI